ncbi:hypothetical protein D5085_16310 [Ectothiorhodospiraceae bacterium BW-2]|nr:hypothetical protein D5085_16310 [Ectothiorhodospiraceae bacterium BW-2]
MLRLLTVAAMVATLWPMVGRGESDYERYLQGQVGAFQSYLAAVNQQFADQLQQEWRQFEAFKAEQLYTVPKLTEAPIAEPEPREREVAAAIEAPTELHDIDLRRLLGDYFSAFESAEAEPLESQRKVESATAVTADEMRVRFFGTEMVLPKRGLDRYQLTGEIDNRTLGGYWQQLSGSDYLPIVASLKRQAEALDLNDWGYYLLVQQYTLTLQDAALQQRLLSWFLLNQSGYQVKIGYNRDTVYLLAVVTDEVYGIPYFKLEGERYYNLTTLDVFDEPGSLRIYKGHFSQAERKMTIATIQPPQLGETPMARLLSFRYGERSYEVPVAFNASLVQYYDTYPQVGLSVLFQAPVDQEAEQSMLTRLQEIIAGQSEVEAVNILLRFVQTAFRYMRDEDQFGGERYLFAQQTLSYPASDCEDRAVLFRHLVTRLLGLEVVGIQYPGHMATAVHFTTSVAGDSLQHQGKRFVICDPTYINARVGESMPNYRGRVEAVLGSG